MRVIYGKKDRPDKSHILIIRGMSDESLNYFKHHVDKYPTWGLSVIGAIFGKSKKKSDEK